MTKITVKDYLYVADSLYGWFSNLSNLQTANLANLDTSRVTDMGSLFYGCSNLRTASVWGWNTAKVTSMSYMFGNCSSITQLKPASWDTSNVTSMSHMFYECSSCDSWSINKMKVGNVVSMWDMFYGCSKMGTSQNFNLSSWDTSKNRDFDNMFVGCTALTTYRRDLNVAGWNTESKYYHATSFDSDYPFIPSWNA